MPYWWQTDHWKKQFPNDVLAECNVSMETIREDGRPNDNIMYCLSWSAPNKAGWPKLNEQRKSGLENAGVTKVTKKPKLMTRFCQVCHKSSHVVNNCWELEKNAGVCPEEWKSGIVYAEKKLQTFWTFPTSEVFFCIFLRRLSRGRNEAKKLRT